MSKTITPVKDRVIRNPKPLSWEVYEPTAALAELRHGVASLGDHPGLRLTDLDLEMLGDTLDYHFLATRHYVLLGYFPDRRQTSRRLTLMVYAGLLARTRRPEWRQANPHHTSWVYALTAFGFQRLKRWAWPTIDEGREFTPLWSNPSSRNNPDHDIGVADMVFALQDQLGLSYKVQWTGSREAIQLLRAESRQSGRLLLSPDALLTVTGPGSNDVILLEYEQPIRPRKATEKLYGYTAYYRVQPWRKASSSLTSEPKALFSVGLVADRERYWAHPLDEVQERASHEAILFDRLWLVGEEHWREGTWALRGVRPREGRVFTPAEALLTEPMARR